MGMGEGLTPRIAELLGTGQRSLHSNQCIWIKSGKHSHPQGISGKLSDHVSIFSRSMFPLSVPTWCNAYNFFTCDRLEPTKSSHQTLDLPKFTRKLIIRLLMTTWCTISQRSKTFMFHLPLTFQDPWMTLGCGEPSRTWWAQKGEAGHGIRQGSCSGSNAPGNSSTFRTWKDDSNLFFNGLV